MNHFIKSYVILSVFVLSGIAHAGLPSDLYSETSVDNTTKNPTNFSRLLILSPMILSPTAQWAPYAGLKLNTDQKSNLETQYNDNYTSTVGGVRAHLIPSVSFYSEYQHIFQLHNQVTSQNDWRSGFDYYSEYFLTAPFTNQKLKNENYASAYYSSRLTNTFAQGFARLYLEQKISENLYWDKYAEVFVQRDQLGFYYNNTQELRLGFRAKSSLLHWEDLFYKISFLSYYAAVNYTDRAYLDSNPYPQNRQEWRALLVISGGSL